MLCDQCDVWFHQVCVNTHDTALLQLETNSSTPYMCVRGALGEEMGRTRSLRRQTLHGSSLLGSFLSKETAVVNSSLSHFSDMGEALT